MFRYQPVASAVLVLGAIVLWGVILAPFIGVVARAL